ncbi:MAG: phage integrase N-terminal SAM-like domain-containing protein, partial [Desulfofustis sp.]|nr:phage integrase N-terminal SAM-like domain-containing protein [Desulfofustis sp.]
ADPRYVKDFLAQLVVKHSVAVGTQNQAFYSLLLFFRYILKRDIGDMKEALRGQQRKRLPVVLSVSETQRLLGQFDGTVSPLDRLGDYGGSSAAVSDSQGKPV